MDFDRTDTALVVIDPQNDVLSEAGVSWGLVGASVRENNTVENLDRLFRAAKEREYQVFISPHYLYPHDLGLRRSRVYLITLYSKHSQEKSGREQCAGHCEHSRWPVAIAGVNSS